MGSWEQLEERWGKLTLSGEEDKTITLGEKLSEEDQSKEQRSLLGKVCTDRTIGKEILKVTMGKIWRISKPEVIHEVEKNMFTITFDTESDKLRVLDGRPWLFDNHLFILKQLDSLLQPKAHAFNT